jgi:serine/threonine kinase 16
MIIYFKGTCEAIRAMHTYRAPVSSSGGAASSSRPSRPTPAPPSRRSHDEEEDERFPQPEGDGEGGYSYDAVSVPLVTKHRVEDEGDVIFEGDEDVQPANGDATGEIVPYAHRDVKPGYVSCLSYA